MQGQLHLLATSLHASISHALVVALDVALVGRVGAGRVVAGSALRTRSHDDCKKQVHIYKCEKQ